ncbi:MAG TPA: DUF6174 domain-containing protein [Allocoleopsis sp.]
MKKILLLGTSLFLLGANAVMACKCAPTTPQQSLERSNAVFSGKVIEIDKSSNPSESNRVTFEVSKTWKGTNQKKLTITTSSSSASCGYSFEAGKEYLVYASSQDNKLQTGSCSGTKALSDARADLAVLGQGKTPTVASSNPAQVQLLRNWQKWRERNITNYRYTLRVSCFCAPEVRQPVIVEVRNGRVASIVSASTGKPVNAEFFKEYDSVPKAFNLVRDAIAKDAHRVSVTFNSTLGYPTDVNIDYSAQMADEERAFTIEKLEVIR